MMLAGETGDLSDVATGGDQDAPAFVEMTGKDAVQTIVRHLVPGCLKRRM